MIGASLTLGFVLMLFLDRLAAGYGHGHAHTSSHVRATSSEDAIASSVHDTETSRLTVGGQPTPAVCHNHGVSVNIECVAGFVCPTHSFICARLLFSSAQAGGIRGSVFGATGICPLL